MQTARALVDRPDAHQPVGERVVAHRGQRPLGIEHRDVEVAQPSAQLGLAATVLGARVAQTLDAGLQATDFVTCEVQPDRAQFVDETAVTAGRVGLSLERCELTAHLAEQVVEAEEVALGGFETAFGTLTTLAEFQDPGRLLDDRAPVLGSRVQHRIELALPDDHVLLPADAGVGEQFLDVE